MKKKFLIFFVLITISLCANYNEKNILIKQASELTTHRQYEKANKIYESLLEKYSDDYTIVEKLCINYLVISKTEKAEDLIKKYQSIFPEFNYLKLKLSILLILFFLLAFIAMMQIFIAIMQMNIITAIGMTM